MMIDVFETEILRVKVQNLEIELRKFNIFF